MFTVVITEKGGAQRRMGFDKSEVTIGRVQGNDIILPKGNVSKRHSRIVLKDNRFIVVDLKSTNGTYVNGRKITSPLVVKPGDKIYIGDFILTVEESVEQGYAEPAPQPQAPPARARKPTQQTPPPPLGGHPPQAAAPQPQPPIQQPRASAPPPLPPREPEPPQPQPAERFALDEEPAEDVAPQPAPQAAPQPVAPQPQPVAPQPQPVAPQPQPQPAPSQPAPSPTARPSAPSSTSVPENALRGVMMRVAQEIDIRAADPASLHDQGRWSHAQTVADTIVGQLQSEGLVNEADRAALVDAAVKEAAGLGALENLLSDDSIREIVVEGPSRIVADLGRGLEPVPGTFSSADQLATIARRLVAQAGEQLDPSRPVHETSLPYGPHVTVVMPPVAVRGPIIEIRRMGRGLTVEALTERGVLSAEMADLLRDAVTARRNVLVTGAVGTGVTTILGAIAGLSSEDERIVTVEVVPDLALERDHVISLATGSGTLGLDAVLSQASRMRADRLVVDDVRGDEVVNVLTEIASRPAGNFVGVHCGAGEGGVEGLRHLMRLGSRAAEDALLALIARAVHVVVELESDEDGARRVTKVTEVTGANKKSVQTQDLFVYDGSFNATGIQPSFKA